METTARLTRPGRQAKRTLLGSRQQEVQMSQRGRRFVSLSLSHSRSLKIIRNVVCVSHLSGNALTSINVVALRQARLLPGWVTVCGRVNHVKSCRYVTSHLGQLSLSSSRGRYISTNLPGWGEGGSVTSVGWQITLCDPIDKWRPVVLR